jgi:hypothetical protein
MSVMAAGMHTANMGRNITVGKIFSDRESVNVAANGDGFGLAIINIADDACVSTFFRLKSKALQIG